MTTELNDLTIPLTLCRCAENFYSRGWMMGTAGNLSARIDENNFLITASGKSKGQLSESDFVAINLTSGEHTEPSVHFTPNNKPSAETAIHNVIYKLFPEAKACFHVHSVDAYLATLPFLQVKKMLLPNIEMIKGFDIWEQKPNIELPLFDNQLAVGDIAKDIEKRFTTNPPRIDALMIKNHGITVWGNSIQQAFNRVEILEFILSFMARKPH